MPRRKISPPIVAVEAILWHDADIQMRTKLDINPVVQHTVGFLVHEDDTQVVLAHEVAAIEDWLEDDMDYTKIPKSLIRERTKFGEVSVAKNTALSGQTTGA